MVYVLTSKHHTKSNAQIITYDFPAEKPSICTHTKEKRKKVEKKTPSTIVDRKYVMFDFYDRVFRNRCKVVLHTRAHTLTPKKVKNQ